MKVASDPKDVQDFQFKQSSTQQIFNGFKSIPTACSLLAADGKRGLLYVGHENKITVLKCNAQTAEEWKFEHELPNPVSRIAVSCDCQYVSITFHKSTAKIYNATSLTNNNLDLLHEIQLSSCSEDVFAYDLKWNPAVPGMFCTVASDHTIGSFVVKTERRTTVGLVAMEKIDGHEILCVAWSPKGKQIVVGCKNGNIVQLKQDLKIARTISGPSPNVGGVIAILWISNYQFCATYQDLNDRSIKVLIVDAPKGEMNGNYTCYEDITYGMPEAETEASYSRYHLDHVAEWGLIIAASSSSTEVAVLGSHDNGNTWEQWQLVDSGRAQLPLIRTTESYPVGIAIDKSSDTKLSLSADMTLPHPVPVLHIFGTSGQLISFHMVNIMPNCPALCTPPTEIVTAVQIPASRPSLLPSEISFNLNSGATSTPRPKEAEMPLERPKILPSMNLFNEPAKMPILTQQQEQQQQQVELKIPKPRSEKVEPAAVNESRLSPVKETTLIRTPPPEKTVVDDSLCLRAYFEEQILFEKELRAKLEPQTWECGTEDEQKRLVTQSSIIDEFLRDLRDTTNSLSSDIAYLKALLLQSFAWLEETKSKNSANATDNPRDRGDRNKIKELQRLFFYAQSQLVQATKALDMEWTEQESRKKSKIKIPSLEFIYQSLKRHSEIIAKEKNLFELQLKKWKSLTRWNRVSGLDRSIAKMNISSITSGGKNTDVGAIELRCKAIESHTRSFSIEKQLKLRDFLLETKPRVIRAINPSPVQDRLEATLSSLASLTPMSSVTRSKPDRVSTEISKDLAMQKINQQSPLGSLNCIVAKFGPPSTGDVVESKNQSKIFSIGNTTPLFGGNALQADKKQIVSPLIQAKPKQNMTVTLNQPGFASQIPSNLRSQAFSDVQSISFGMNEQKSHEQGAMVSNDVVSKEMKFTTSKDNFSIAGSTFFQDTKPSIATPSPGLTLMRNEPNVTSTSNSSFLGLTDSTTIQQVLHEPVSSTFNFTSSLQSAKSTETVTPTSGLQNFSFASKPSDSQTFSFASKDSGPVTQTLAQDSSDLPGLFDFDLASIGSQPFEKYSGPGIICAEASATDPSSVSTVSTTAPSRSHDLSTQPSSGNIFGNTPVDSTASGTNSNKVLSTAPKATIFGTTTGAASIFGGSSSVGLSSSLFGGMSSGVSPGLSSSIAVGQMTPTTTSSETPASKAPPTFGTSGTTTGVPKACTESNGTTGFGKLPINFSSPTFGGILGSPTTTLNFGTAISNTTTPPAFGKVTEMATGGFNQTQVASATSPITTKSPTTSSPSGLFTGNARTSSNNSVFGNISAAPALPIFGGGNSNPVASSVFETNAASLAPFSSPSSATIFGGAVQKSSSSVFGGGTASPISPFGGGGSQAANPSVVVSPQAPPAFGQSPAFGVKPVFGVQTSVFGAAKPDFSNPFGGSTFGATAVPTGFSGPPAMGGSPPSLGTASMQKVFGNPVGESTFESLAGQTGGLTFGNLAQKTPETQTPPSFSGGSSFSSWR